MEQAFPVSSGNQHKTKENTNEATVEGIDGSVAAAEQVFQAAIQTEVILNYYTCYFVVKLLLFDADCDLLLIQV